MVRSLYACSGRFVTQNVRVLPPCDIKVESRKLKLSGDIMDPVLKEGTKGTYGIKIESSLVHATQPFCQ